MAYPKGIRRNADRGDWGQVRVTLTALLRDHPVRGRVSRKALARAIGVSDKAVRNWLSGVDRPGALEQRAIAKWLREAQLALRPTPAAAPAVPAPAARPPVIVPPRPEPLPQGTISMPPGPQRDTEWRWYLTATAVEQWMHLTGRRSLAAAQADLGELSIIARAIPRPPSQSGAVTYRGAVMLRGKRRRVECTVMPRLRDEGVLPQLLRVQLK